MTEEFGDSRPRRRLFGRRRPDEEVAEPPPPVNGEGTPDAPAQSSGAPILGSTDAPGSRPEPAIDRPSAPTEPEARPMDSSTGSMREGSPVRPSEAQPEWPPPVTGGTPRPVPAPPSPAPPPSGPTPSMAPARESRPAPSPPSTSPGSRSPGAESRPVPGPDFAPVRAAAPTPASPSTPVAREPERPTSASTDAPAAPAAPAAASEPERPERPDLPGAAALPDPAADAATADDRRRARRPAARAAPDHRHRQPEGWRGQDHDRGEPRCRPGGVGPPGPGGRPRPPGQRVDRAGHQPPRRRTPRSTTSSCRTLPRSTRSSRPASRTCS